MLVNSQLVASSQLDFLYSVTIYSYYFLEIILKGVSVN